MKNSIRRVIMVFLCLIMVIGLMPSAAAEYDSEPVIPEPAAEEQNSAATGNNAVISGSCGANVSYELDGNYTLIVYGNGPMYNYNVGDAPWYGYRNVIKRVKVHYGVTSIGESAFVNLPYLATVELANSVTSIGNFAFAVCNNISTMELPWSLKSIGDSAFFSALNMTTLRIPASMENIDHNAFGLCKIKKIVFLGNAPTIGHIAFDSDTAKAYYPSNNRTWTASKRQNYGGTLTWVGVSDPKITTQPKTATVKAGKKASFKVKASGGALSYQWFCLKKGSTNWVAVTSGGKSATLKVSAKKNMNGNKYRCTVTNVFGSVTSKAVKLKVKK